MIDDTAPAVDPSNAEMLRAWDGADGAYWAEHEEVFDRSVGSYTDRFLAAAEIGRTERVLDVGCGTGSTTRAAARLAPAGSALGVDLSAAMLARARQRAAGQGLGNVEFLHADAQVHPFDAGSFDVVISRTGAMFFGDPVAAFRNLAAALRPAGRLCLLVWQAPGDNEWLVELLRAASGGATPPAPPPGAPGPFSLADPGHVRAVLTAGGFTDVALADVHGPTWFGPDAESAYRFVSGLGAVRHLLGQLPDADRSRARAALRASVDAHTGPEGCRYRSAAWLVTAVRG